MRWVQRLFLGFLLVFLSINLNPQCPPNCAVCDSSATCLECSASNPPMILQPSGCVCPGGYYMKQNGAQCQVCDPTCLTCALSTHSPGQSVCTSCESNMLLVAGVCVCLYVNLQTLTCGYQCTYQCATCALGTCASCGINRPTTMPCTTCNNGYYDDGVSSDCSCNTVFFMAACSNLCSSCSGSADNCVTCADGISPPPLCLCVAGTYASANMCLACATQCATCIFSETQCTSCSDPINTLLQDGCLPTPPTTLAPPPTTSTAPAPILDTTVNPTTPILNTTIPQPDLNQSIVNTTNAITKYLAVGDKCSTCLATSGHYCLKYKDGTCQCNTCSDPNCHQCHYVEGQKDVCTICARDYSPNNSLCELTLECGLGLYYDVGLQACQAICGDGIIMYTYGEQCDFGDFNNWRGCTSTCQFVHVMAGCDPSLDNRFCSQQQVIMRVGYADQTTNNLLVQFQGTNNSYCDRLNYEIRGFSNYTYATAMMGGGQCLIRLLTSPTLMQTDEISTRITSYPNDSVWFDITTPMTFAARWTPNYTCSQLVQGEVAQRSMISINQILIIVFCSTIALGGFTLLWDVFDLYNWCVTFYFFNVNFPLNLQRFFFYASKGQIMYLSNPVILNNSTEPYDIQINQRFQDQGQDSLFLNNIWYDIYAFAIFLFCYPFAWVTYRSLTTNPQTIALPIQPKLSSPIVVRARKASLPIITDGKRRSLLKVNSQALPVNVNQLMVVQPTFQQLPDEAANLEYHIKFAVIKQDSNISKSAVSGVASPSGLTQTTTEMRRAVRNQKKSNHNTNSTFRDPRSDQFTPKNDESLSGSLQLSMNLTQTKSSCLQRLKRLLLKMCRSYTQKISQKLLRVFYLTMLDFEIASILQFQGFKMGRYSIVSVNIALSLIYQFFSIYYIYLCYVKVRQSKILLLHPAYRRKYVSLYQEYDPNHRTAYLYSFSLVAKKKLYVISIVALFNFPILQSVTCSLSTFLCMILILYDNPFKSNSHRIRVLIPEISVCIVTSSMILYAFNDRVIFTQQPKFALYTMDQQFALGWMVIVVITMALIIETLCILAEFKRLSRKRLNLLVWLLLNKRN